MEVTESLRRSHCTKSNELTFHIHLLHSNHRPHHATGHLHTALSAQAALIVIRVVAAPVAEKAETIDLAAAFAADERKWLGEHTILGVLTV